MGKYIVGDYDLLIPVYPKMEVKGVRIEQSKNTTVTIPAPGYVTFNTGQRGCGSLYQIKNSGEQVWVMNLLENTRTQAYHLQPGSYQIVFRRNDHKYEFLCTSSAKEGNWRFAFLRWSE